MPIPPSSAVFRGGAAFLGGAAFFGGAACFAAAFRGGGVFFAVFAVFAAVVFLAGAFVAVFFAAFLTGFFGAGARLVDLDVASEDHWSIHSSMTRQVVRAGGAAGEHAEVAAGDDLEADLGRTGQQRRRPP